MCVETDSAEKLQALATARRIDLTPSAAPYPPTCVAMASVTGLGPTPGRRTRPLGSAPNSNSATPRCTRDFAGPDARATAAIPPNHHQTQ